MVQALVASQFTLRIQIPKQPYTLPNTDLQTLNPSTCLLGPLDPFGLREIYVPCGAVEVLGVSGRKPKSQARAPTSDP